MLKQLATPGILRSGINLIGYGLYGLFILMLGHYAPVNVINPVAYLLGVFNLIVMFTSPGAASYATCSLTPLYLTITLLALTAILLHPPYWWVTMPTFILYVYLHMQFIRRVELPRFRQGREASWSLAVLPYVIGGRVVQLALGALALINPALWVIALTAPLPLGQWLNNIAYRGRSYECGSASWVKGLEFSTRYHAPYALFNIIYLIYPAQSASWLINTAPAQALLTAIQVDKLWGRKISTLRYLAMPISVAAMWMLEKSRIINPTYMATIPLALIITAASTLTALLITYHVVP